MRQPFSCQVRRNFLSGIQVEFKQSVHQRSLRAQLYWLQVNTHVRTHTHTHICPETHAYNWHALLLQVDNQLPGAIFPIVFHPVPPPKSIALDSGKSPCLPALSWHLLSLCVFSCFTHNTNLIQHRNKLCYFNHSVFSNNLQIKMRKCIWCWSLTLSSASTEPKPFVDVSVITRFNQHSSIMQFKWVTTSLTWW